MGLSVDVLLRQVRNLFDLEVLMMKRYINYSIIYSIGNDWWSILS